MPDPTPTRRSVLVVLRAWPQQENPALPLLAADAPAVLAGRVATAVADLPADLRQLAAVVTSAAADLHLVVPEPAALQAVCAHAVGAAGAVGGTLRLVCADIGAATLTYALLSPELAASATARVARIAVAQPGRSS